MTSGPQRTASDGVEGRLGGRLSGRGYRQPHGQAFYNGTSMHAATHPYPRYKAEGDGYNSTSQNNNNNNNNNTSSTSSVGGGELELVQYEAGGHLHTMTLAYPFSTYPFCTIEDYKKTEGESRSLKLRLDATSQQVHTAAQTWLGGLIAAVSDFFAPKFRHVRLIAQDSIIQVTAPHPHSQYVAIGRRDGSVEIRGVEKGYVDVLSIPESSFSIKRDRIITAVAWCPARKDLLCVATRKNVLLWTLGKEKEACQYSELCSGGAYAVAWSPCGLYVLIAPIIGGLILWDVTTQTMLRVQAREHFRLIEWDPSGRRVIAASWGKQFIVFDVQDGWSATHMQAAHSCLVSVCWSRTGDYFLCAEKNSTVVQCFQFVSKQMPAMKEILSTVDIDCHEQETITGLAWDCNSERLAISTERQGRGVGKIRMCVTSPRTSSIHATSLGYVIERSGKRVQDIRFGVGEAERVMQPVLVSTWTTSGGGTIETTPLIYTPTSC